MTTQDFKDYRDAIVSGLQEVDSAIENLNSVLEAHGAAYDESDKLGRIPGDLMRDVYGASPDNDEAFARASRAVKTRQTEGTRFHQTFGAHNEVWEAWDEVDRHLQQLAGTLQNYVRDTKIEADPSERLS